MATSSSSSPSSAAPAGWLGWAAHGAASPAAAPGWLGWVAHGEATPAAAPGWLGWVAHAATNLHLTVLLPPTQAPADTYVPLRLTLGPTTPSPAEAPRQLAYAAPGRYALSVPPGVPLTLTATSPRYEVVSEQFTIEAGAVRALTVQLAFRAGQARATKVRRRYLFTRLLLLLAYVAAHPAPIS